MRALDDFVRQGKVRHMGCSNLTGAQVVEAQGARNGHSLALSSPARTNTACLRRIERELVPDDASPRHGLLPYFPLASGLFTGKSKRGAQQPPDARLSDQRLRTAT